MKPGTAALAANQSSKSLNAWVADQLEAAARAETIAAPDRKAVVVKRADRKVSNVKQTAQRKRKEVEQRP